MKDFWQKIVPAHTDCNIRYLFKFGKREHMEQLRDEGLVYLNSLSYFRALEKDLNRSDENECLTAVYHKTHDMWIGDHVIPAENIPEIKMTLHHTWHVFCMFGIIDHKGKMRFPIIDRRIYEDGEWDTAAAIVSPPFFNRLRNKLDGTPAWGVTPVEYVDLKTYNGVVGPFRKDRRFAYQNECRLAFFAKNDKPRILRLGSLKDCIRLVPTKEMPDCFKFPNVEGQKLREGCKIEPVEIEGVDTETVYCIGDSHLIFRPATAFFCSQKCPGDRIIKLYELARQWRNTGEPIISGFHSPMEKEVLDILLKGKQPIIVCPARAIHNMRIPANWKKHIDEGRLLILSLFEEKHKRVTAEHIRIRNRFVAAFADNVFVVHTEPGSSLDTLMTELRAKGKPIRA